MILPVIVGYDIGAYSFARIFHENSGVTSVVLTEAERGPINDSRILDVRLFPKGTFDNDERFLQALAGIEQEFAGRELILCVNADEYVEFVARHASQLEGRWFLPYSPQAAVTLANSKGEMAGVLTELGYAAPRRVVVDPSRGSAELDHLTYPVVVKPESGADLAANWNRGLRKVELWENREAGEHTMKAFAQAGMTARIIVQEFIPGDDTTQWLVNGYVDSSGRVTACGSGRLILGLHQPEYVGNAGIVLTMHNAELIEAAKRIVTRVGIRGFFSMDVKVDPRDGTAYWLDLNPRIGRGHYYMKVAGIDLAAAMLADMRGEAAQYQTNSGQGIFCIIPPVLANAHYVRDSVLLAEVKRARHRRRPVNPLAYRADRHPKRLAYRTANAINQLRRMKRFYPEPDSGRL